MGNFFMFKTVHKNDDIYTVLMRKDYKPYNGSKTDSNSSTED